MTDRGHRLPADWQPSPEARQFAIGLGIDPNKTGDNFRDYWIAVPGARGRKLDWAATWRNWCRAEAEKLRITNKRLIPATMSQNPAPFEGEPWEARLKGYSGPRSYWSQFWGPRPGESGCRVPGAILERLGLS